MQNKTYSDFVIGIAGAKTAVESLPQSRELSIVKTKLDEARLWFEEWRWRDEHDPDRCE